jgi:hypothetical protein
MFETVTNAASTPIVPQDRFIAECIRLEEAPPYAPPGEKPKPGAKNGIKWVFALYYAATGERFHFQDEPYEFFQTTTANMQRGARAREYVEAFLGRELAEGENVNPSDILGKRCVGMVIHELSRDKTKKTAKLAGVEPYRAPVTPNAARPSAASVSANPSEDEIDRALLVSKLNKQVTRLTVLDEDAGAAAKQAVEASDLDTAPLPEIETLLDQINSALAKAMAA